MAKAIKTLELQYQMIQFLIIIINNTILFPSRCLMDLVFQVVGRGGGGGGGAYSHTLPIRVCAAKRGRDFEAPDLERGVHFRGVF